MNDLVLIKTDFYELRIDMYGNFYRYDVVLNTTLSLTDKQAKDMMLVRREELNK